MAYTKAHLDEMWRMIDLEGRGKVQLNDFTRFLQSQALVSSGVTIQVATQHPWLLRLCPHSRQTTANTRDKKDLKTSMKSKYLRLEYASNCFSTVYICFRFFPPQETLLGDALRGRS